MIPGIGGTPEPDGEVPRIDIRVILGRVEVRDRDLSCVSLIVLMQGLHQSTWVKITVFQQFGYQPTTDSALFAGLGCFHHPEHRRWGWNLRDCAGGIIPALPGPVQLLFGKFGDRGTSFEECGGFASLVFVDFPVPWWRRVG